MNAGRVVDLEALMLAGMRLVDNVAHRQRVFVRIAPRRQPRRFKSRGLAVAFRECLARDVDQCNYTGAEPRLLPFATPASVSNASNERPRLRPVRAFLRDSSCFLSSAARSSSRAKDRAWAASISRFGSWTFGFGGLLKSAVMDFPRSVVSDQHAAQS